MGLRSFLYAYLLGGLTFIPLVLAVGFYYVYTYGSTPIGDSDPLKRLKKILSDTQGDPAATDAPLTPTTPTTAVNSGDNNEKAGSSSNRNRSTSNATGFRPAPAGTVFPTPKLTDKHLTGWLTIRRSFGNEKASTGGSGTGGLLGGSAGTHSSVGAATETVVGNFKSGLLENKTTGEKSNSARPDSTEKVDPTSTTAAAGVTGKYSSMLLNSYRSIVDGGKNDAATGSAGTRTVIGPSGSSTSVHHSAIKEFVFCALKGNVLFMYEDASMENCLGVIGIEGYSVSISRGEGESDDELSSEDSDALDETEQELLNTSGLSEEKQHQIRSKATRKKRKKEARGGSDFLDGELFAKRNAIVLRAVPMQPRVMRRTKSNVVTVPETGIRSGPEGTMRGGAKDTTGMGHPGDMQTASGGLAGDLALKPVKSQYISVPTDKPSLQRKSTLPTGSGDTAALVGGPDALNDPALGPGAGPPIMALTKDMDSGLIATQMPSESSAAGNKTVLQDNPTERERRRKEKRRREEKRLDVEARPWYIFARNNIKQEQWYHALLLRSHPSPPANSKIHVPRPTFNNVFSTSDMQKLIDTLNEDSDSIPVRWLNAMLGRVFLGICGTAALEAFIIAKVMKKVKKVKTPSFLGDIIVKEIDVGTTPPYFSKPMLKELTAEGEASFEVNLRYAGEIRITIGTTAIIPTGFGFKPYNINLELMVVVKSVEGNVCVRIKKPPSNRVWWGFTTPPKIDLRVLPVVSDRKIQVNMVLKAIEKQIRDAVNDSIVLPNMDDLAFFDTRHLQVRGGIFDEAGKSGSVPVKADLGPDGLEPIPTGKSGQKPVREKEEHPKRAATAPIASQSIAVQALDLSQGKSVKPAGVEADAQSLGGASTHSITKSISENTRKWLATKTGGFDSGPEDERRASEPGTPVTPAGTARRAIEKTGNGFEIKSSGTSTPVEAVDTSVESVATASQIMDRAQDDNVALDSLPLNKSAAAPPQTFVPRGTLPSQSVDQDNAAAAQGSAATAAALMNNLRARTADKKALQSSVNEARDAMKKWGKNWAAKRTVGGYGPTASTQDEQISQKLQAVEQQIQKTQAEVSPTRSVDVPARTGTSLQERLAMAASHAASLSSGGSPTTTAKQGLDAGSIVSTSSIEERRRNSVNEARPTLPVRHQPTGVAAMAVPRIPKRADAVTAISSETSQSNSHEDPPALPSRVATSSSPRSPTVAATTSKTPNLVPSSTSTTGLSQLLATHTPSPETSRPPSRPKTPEQKSNRPPSLPSRSRATSIRGFELPQEASTSVTLPERPLTPSKTTAQDALKGLVAADERSRASSKPTTPTHESPAA